MSMFPRRSGLVGAAVALVLIASGCATSVAPSSPAPTATAASPGDIRIGAAFPLSSNAGGLAGRSSRASRPRPQFVNTDGGIDGRRITLDVQDLDQGADAPAVMRTLKVER